MAIFKRESLKLAFKPLTLSIALLTATASAPSFAEWRIIEAVKDGKAFADLRLRYENADIENGNGVDADALTLRTTFGYETGTYNGFSVLVEAEDVREVLGVNDFTVNPAGVRVDQFDTIADPETTELEQAYLQYKAGGFTGKFGRQTLTLDNHRFVGHVGWRQDRQTFDAFKLNYNQNGLDLTAAYITQRNRIFAEVLDEDAQDIILNASYKADGFGKLTAYSYIIEDDDTDDQELETYGVSYAGSTKAGSSEIDYRAEYATQENQANNAETDYFHVNGGIKFGPVKLGLGYEVLGSDDGIDGFATPLATLHGFNGWADVFLGTPSIGLEDAYASLDFSIAKGKGGKFKLVYHDFTSDEVDAFGSDDLGDEIDVQYTYNFNENVYSGIKYATYSSGSAVDTDGATENDTDRFWLWAGLKFK